MVQEGECFSLFDNNPEYSISSHFKFPVAHVHQEFELFSYFCNILLCSLSILNKEFHLTYQLMDSVQRYLHP